MGSGKLIYIDALVVGALLAEQSLTTPEISRSNPVIGKTFTCLSTVFQFRQDKNRQKEAENGQFLKII